MCLSDDLAYEVKWFFTRLRGGPASVQVASVDRFGVVRKINRNSSSDVTIERKDTHTYLLNIFGTQDRWGANEWFVCLIPFWLRDLHSTMTVITTACVLCGFQWQWGVYLLRHSLVPVGLNGSLDRSSRADIIQSLPRCQICRCGAKDTQLRYNMNTLKHKSLWYMCVILLYVTPILLFPLSFCSLGLPKVTSLIWCISLTG